jgi:hypothetical protein
MPADLLIDGDQFGTQFLEAVVLIDFGLRFAPSGGRRKRLGDGLALHLACKPKLRYVPWVLGLGTVARRLSATARDRADRTLAQIAEGSELTKDLGAFGFPLQQRIGHTGAS